MLYDYFYSLAFIIEEVTSYFNPMNISETPLILNIFLLTINIKKFKWLKAKFMDKSISNKVYYPWLDQN